MFDRCIDCHDPTIPDANGRCIKCAVARIEGIPNNYVKIYEKVVGQPAPGKDLSFSEFEKMMQLPTKGRLTWDA